MSVLPLWYFEIFLDSMDSLHTEQDDVYSTCCNLFQRSLDEMEDIVYCPRCQAVVIREQDTTLNLGYCLACCFSFCTECEQPWHQVNIIYKKYKKL